MELRLKFQKGKTFHRFAIHSRNTHHHANYTCDQLRRIGKPLTLLYACRGTSCCFRMLTGKLKHDLRIRRLTSKKSDVSTNDVRENTNLNIGVTIIR